MNATTRHDITAYVEGVRAALAGLPEETRRDLLEDLPDHLAEGQGSLVDRLGTPEAYAAELLAAAGLPDGVPDPVASRRSATASAREAADRALRLLRTADGKVGPVIGYAAASDFLRLLRPAWWVLRGYLLAMVLAIVLDDSGQSPGLLPRIGGSDLVALALLAGCAAVSILFGRRRFVLTRWPRYALWSGTALLVVVALAGFASADRTARNPGYQDVSNWDGNPYTNVQDVYVYDGQGRLVQGARLFDQDGSPIQLGSAWCTDPETGETVHARSLGYPYCPQNAPFSAPSPSTPSPSPSTPSPSPSAPSPSATPGRGSPPVSSGATVSAPPSR